MLYLELDVVKERVEHLWVGTRQTINVSREEPVIDDPVKVKQQMYFISSWDESHDS